MRQILVTSASGANGDGYGTVLSGDVTYSPDPLEAPADGQVLICCAQPTTDIVLDM
jgi:hypothetical protein